MAAACARTAAPKLDASAQPANARSATAADGSSGSTGNQHPTGSCQTTLELARRELLERGFAPTTDTEHWLRVDDTQPDQLQLSIVMRQSADGASTWYSLKLVPGAQGSFAWQKSVQKLCCDEHAAAEDNLEELTWKRQRDGQTAVVSIAYFAAVNDVDYAAERELFAEVAKRAGDECLDDATPRGR